MQANSSIPTSAESFGEYLQRLRHSKGFTQYGLGKISGVSRPYIEQIEIGRKPAPSPGIIRSLSAALGVTHVGMMIKAGHITLEEVLTCREEHGITQH
ncbi:HTH-type transcriptional repressor RghR [compost metagenome]